MIRPKSVSNIPAAAGPTTPVSVPPGMSRIRPRLVSQVDVAGQAVAVIVLNHQVVQHIRELIMAVGRLKKQVVRQAEELVIGVVVIVIVKDILLPPPQVIQPPLTRAIPLSLMLLLHHLI